MDKRNTLFCYTISDELDNEIQELSQKLQVKQADFIRTCLNKSIGSKTAANKLIKKIKSNGGYAAGAGKKKKLIYLSEKEYKQLQSLHRINQMSMANILRSGIEANKDKVLKSAMEI